MFRRTPIFLLSVACGLAPTSFLRAQETAAKLARDPSIVRGDELNAAQRTAVDKGLAWLARAQGADGSFGGDGLPKNAAVTALAGIALMEAGNLPGRGKYGQNVAKCLAFILSITQESGLIAGDQSHGPMYGHG
ncbi:MAG: prenyltransferase, partial [Phycisphaerae bacterium]|nr:prenyltransferase [Phycisphaerae bacterium]